MPAKPRFPWIRVSVSAALLLVVMVAGLRLPESAGPRPAGAALPALGLTRDEPSSSAELLAEQLAAYDPTPMFIPTEMNSSEPPASGENRPGAAGPFAELAPGLTKTRPLTLPSPVPLPANPTEALRLTERADAPLAFVRTDTSGPALARRNGRVEAFALGGKRLVLALDLPDSIQVPSADWQPLELMGAITRAGLVGELVVTTSSGSGEIDDFFRSNLRTNLRVDARLKAGFYTFSVGP